MDDEINHKQIFDQMPVSRFLMVKSGDDYQFKRLNQKALAFFDLEDDDGIGKFLSDFTTEANYRVLKESLNVSLEKKIPVTVPSLPDFMGQMRTLGFWINPVLNDSGEVLWLDVIGQPGATDIALVQRERDDALSLLTAIFDASEVGILVFDKNRTIIKANDSFERIFGWANNEAMGKDFIDFLTSDEKKVGRDSYKHYLKSDDRHTGEVKIMCKDGTIANVMYTTAPLKLSHARRFQVTTLVDITKWKQVNMSLKLAKDQADSASNAKSAFLANMSHELRTPLNAIIGFSEMMENEVFGSLGNEKYNEYISDVHISAKHLLDIINEVLDMSKIEAGKVELDEQKIDLNVLCTNLVRIMRSEALNVETNIIEDYDSFLPKLYADARLIRQILINLLTNSIKYSVDGGDITLITKLNQKDEIEITVQDEGVGIPKDRLKEALEPFGQIHDPHTASKAFQGTGLGLPLAKAMVEIHGGVFQVHSAEGKGTTVNISFSASRTKK